MCRTKATAASTLSLSLRRPQRFDVLHCPAPDDVADGFIYPVNLKFCTRRIERHYFSGAQFHSLSPPCRTNTQRDRDRCQQHVECAFLAHRAHQACMRISILLRAHSVREPNSLYALCLRRPIPRAQIGCAKKGQLYDYSSRLGV